MDTTLVINALDDEQEDTTLTSDCEYDCVEAASSLELLEKHMFTYTAYVRACYTWFHSAHLCSAGESFSGDHSFLYDKIYNDFFSKIDQVIEKSLGLGCMTKIACPQSLSIATTQIICSYPSPCELSPAAVAAAGHSLVCDIITFVEMINSELDEAGLLSLGLSDMLANHASDFESHVYLLKQRMKVCINS